MQAEMYLEIWMHRSKMAATLFQWKLLLRSMKASPDAHLCFLHNYAVWTKYYNNTLCAVLLEFVAKIARRPDYA